MNESLANYEFAIMNEEELLLIDGGGILGKALAITGACVLIAAGGVSVIAGVGVAVGTGGAATLPGVKLACAGVGGIIAGAKMLDVLIP